MGDAALKDVWDDWVHAKHIGDAVGGIDPVAALPIRVLAGLGARYRAQIATSERMLRVLENTSEAPPCRHVSLRSVKFLYMECVNCSAAPTLSITCRDCGESLSRDCCEDCTGFAIVGASTVPGAP